MRCVHKDPKHHQAEIGFYTLPSLEVKIGRDTLTPPPAPVVYNISRPRGGGIFPVSPYALNLEGALSPPEF